MTLGKSWILDKSPRNFLLPLSALPFWENFVGSCKFCWSIVNSLRVEIGFYWVVLLYIMFILVRTYGPCHCNLWVEDKISCLHGMSVRMSVCGVFAPRNCLVISLFIQTFLFAWNWINASSGRKLWLKIWNNVTKWWVVGLDWRFHGCIQHGLNSNFSFRVF